MELRAGGPPDGFRESLAVSYDAAAASRQEMGEADWRWPITSSFLALMRDEGRTRLLEVGAGVGFTSRWFADHGCHVVATDLSPAQVQLCRDKGIEAHVRDMYDLGFSPGSFDALWAMNCVHHVPSTDFTEVLRGFADVVGPGGLVYLGVWGGRDDEGMFVDDFYPPSRFFCLRSDASLLEAVRTEFEVLTFETFLPDLEDHDTELHMQSVVMRAL